MALRNSRFSAGLALAACLATAATPAYARGWGGWGGGYHHRHHDDIDAGDIFAGLLVIGTIAAVASAASNSDKNSRERDYRYPEGDYREPAPRYGDDSEDRSGASQGIDDAVASCVEEVERSGPQVDTVDSVDREGDGWRIAGRVGDNRDFACSVSGSGQIRSVTVDGRAR